MTMIPIKEVIDQNKNIQITQTTTVQKKNIKQKKKYLVHKQNYIQKEYKQKQQQMIIYQNDFQKTYRQNKTTTRKNISQ